MLFAKGQLDEHITRIFYPFLNLITCAGDWIPSQHQTTLRLVVYTYIAQFNVI